MAHALVELTAADIGYGRRRVLRGVTLTVESQDFLALVGPNGSGKTTVLRALAGILPPRAGHVRRAPGVTVGYVVQERSLDSIFPLSALDVVLQGRIARRSPWRRAGAGDVAAAHAALAQTGVGDLAAGAFAELSGGQKQRVLIARALAGDPSLLVLDEPTAGADPPAERAIMELLARLRGTLGLAVVVASHDLTLVANYAARLALLHRAGGGLTVGATADVLTDERLTALYGAAMRVRRTDGWQTIIAGGAPWLSTCSTGPSSSMR